jgi:hypothetical protein
VAGAPPPPKEIVPLPIEMAMDKIEVPDQVIMPSNKPMMHADSPGAKIYPNIFLEAPCLEWQI